MTTDAAATPAHAGVLGHVVPVWIYLAVFTALLVFTGVTVMVAIVSATATL
jgi:hypothetical protein